MPRGRAGRGSPPGELRIAFAGRRAEERGAKSTSKNYGTRPCCCRTFPGVILCTSVNGADRAGIPGKRKLRDGENQSRIAARRDRPMDGSSMPRSRGGGRGVRPRRRSSSASTEEALVRDRRGPGRQAPGGYRRGRPEVGRIAGLQPWSGTTSGTGIGRAMHEDPQVPNYGAGRAKDFR